MIQMHDTEDDIYLSLFGTAVFLSWHWKC